MLKLIAPFALAVVPLALTASIAPATPVAPVDGAELQQVKRYLAAVTSMTATFAQTDRSGKTLMGTLTLRRPGKARFQYEKGVPYLAVADGNSLYFIDYSVKQVSRWPIKESPLTVLLDPDRDISGIATVQPTGNPDIISVEVRDPKHREFGRITLIFERDGAGPAGLMFQGWVALDAQGNRTTIRLSNQQFNVPVSDGTFRWNDPRSRGGRP